MNGILGFIDLLRNVGLSENEQNLYYEMVKKSSDRLLTTINDIIEISKIESGQTPVISTVEDVKEVMQYLLVTFQPVAEEKGLKFSINDNGHSKPVLIKTDKIKLEVILKNLIRNAIKFTSEGGVEIGYKAEDKTITFCISDTGPGIAKERLHAIFDRFVQADLNLTRPYEGSGLGLSITRAYADMLQGDLWVESEPGRGSKFYFSLNHNSIVSIN
jgi:signal transduction histidine kinase